MVRTILFRHFSWNLMKWFEISVTDTNLVDKSQKLWFMFFFWFLWTSRFTKVLGLNLYMRFWKISLLWFVLLFTILSRFNILRLIFEQFATKRLCNSSKISQTFSEFQFKQSWWLFLNSLKKFHLILMIIQQWNFYR